MEEDIQSYSPTVMFRGTPCILKKIEKFLKIKVHLKGSCSRKIKGGYRRTAKNNRFRSLLILLLSVTSIRRKLLKTI